MKKVSNIMLVVIVIMIVSFVVASFWMLYQTGYEISSTLTTCWFSFWTVEIVSLAYIKTSKVKYGTDNQQTNDEDSNDDNLCG